MKILAFGAVACALALGGCGANSPSSSNLNSFITTLSGTNCHVTGTLSARLGAMNPGSGAELTTSIDCPNGGAANTSKLQAGAIVLSPTTPPSPAPAPATVVVTP